ncbi:MAG: hypothetical protein E7624_09290 [Ruminococcaceae bacterium]|nr:hypothetical protein [Oscillospiraceae bacterium]
MKKIILLSILLLAVLLNLFSCSKEAEYVPEYGTFYVSDGILQNTHVTLVIENETLTAPVTEFSYKILNATTCEVQAQGEFLLEIYLDGKWQKAAEAPADDAIVIEPGILPRKISPRSGKNYVAQFEKKGTSHKAGTYAWLYEGVYRIRIQYHIDTDEPETEKPEGVPEAVAYFTVKAPQP